MQVAKYFLCTHVLDPGEDLQPGDELGGVEVGAEADLLLHLLGGVGEGRAGQHRGRVHGEPAHSRRLVVSVYFGGKMSKNISVRFDKALKNGSIKMTRGAQIANKLSRFRYI